MTGGGPGTIAATIPTVDARLRAAMATLPPPGQVVLDLTAVVGISAAGVRLLVTVADVCVARELDVRFVVAPSSIVHRVCTITGVDKEIAVFDDLDQAVRAN